MIAIITIIANFLKWNVGRLFGLVVRIFRSPVATAFAAGAAVVGVMWWYSPDCQEKALAARLDAEIENRAVSERLVESLQKERRKIRGELTKAKRIIHELVPKNPDCNYSAGAVRLLNRARTGVPETPAVPSDRSASAATDYSQRKATEQWAEDANQYRQCRAQLIRLIEWHAAQKKAR